MLNKGGEQPPPTKTFGIGIVEPLFSFYHFLHPSTLGGRGTATLRFSPPFSLLIIDKRIFMIIDRRVFLISGLMNELKSMMSRVPLSMMIEDNDRQDMIKIKNHQESS
jgi:hypothetical protein